MSNERKCEFGSKPGAGYAAVFACALVLYVLSCAPGELWQDSGMYQYRVWHNDIEGGLGLALSHPLYHIIGIGVKHIPLGEFAYRVNLISAICGAFAIANLFLLLRLWLGKNLPAVIGAITLAFSWTAWQFASIAEVYTLYMALFLGELVALLQYFRTRQVGYLYLLAFLNGLAIANHMWAVIALVCYVVLFGILVFRRKIDFRHLGIVVGLWIVGAAPYEYLIIKNILQTGDVTATLASAFFGNNWQGNVLNTSLSARIVKENLLFILYNFSTPNILLFFVGLYGLYKVSPSRTFANILLALLILFFVFAFRYKVPDRHVFFIPFYCLVSALVGVGFGFLAGQIRFKGMPYLILAFSLLPIASYIAAPIVAKKAGFEMPAKRTIPYRNDYEWFLRPWKTGYREAEQFTNDIFKTVENNAVIYADGTTVYPLLYAQELKGLGRDVTVVSGHGTANNLQEYNEDVIDKLFVARPIYVVSPVAGYCPKFLLERFDFVKAGVLWRVKAKPAIR